MRRGQRAGEERARRRLDRNRQELERLQVATNRLGKAHHDLEAAVALEHLAGLAAGERGAHDVLHVRDVEAEARDRRPVDLDRERRQPGDLLDLDVGGAANRPQDRGDAVRGRRA